MPLAPFWFEFSLTLAKGDEVVEVAEEGADGALLGEGRQRDPQRFNIGRVVGRERSDLAQRREIYRLEKGVSELLVPVAHVKGVRHGVVVKKERLLYQSL